MTDPNRKGNPDALPTIPDQKLDAQKDSKQSVELQQAKTALSVYLQERNPTTIQELKAAVSDFSTITKAGFSDHDKLIQVKTLPDNPVKVLDFQNGERQVEVAVFIFYDDLSGFVVQLYHRKKLPNNPNTPWYLMK